MSLATADASTSTPQSRIRVQTKYVPPAERSLPPLAVQVTELVGSYMVWVGTTTEPPESVANAPLQGALARDWACAMPPRDMHASLPPAGTSLYRTSSSDVALAMAQRLARRFKKQIFLSVDVPPSAQEMGQGPRLILSVERAVVETLKELESVRS